jgi:hypothetical protein
MKRWRTDGSAAIRMMQAPSRRGWIQTALKTLIYEALDK